MGKYLVWTITLFWNWFLVQIGLSLSQLNCEAFLDGFLDVLNDFVEMVSTWKEPLVPTNISFALCFVYDSVAGC